MGRALFSEISINLFGAVAPLGAPQQDRRDRKEEAVAVKPPSLSGYRHLSRQSLELTMP
jgi:hypothetical protein